MQIRQWSPFANTRWYLIWDRETAIVWAWDAESTEAAIRAQRLNPGKTPVIPETLLHPRQKQGCFLVSCIEGHEGQVWLDGALIGSRWWPEIPGVNEWMNFQRDVGAAAEYLLHDMPLPLPPVLREQPWEKSAATAHAAEYRGRAEQWTVTLATFVLAAVSLWYGAQFIKLQTAINERTAELETLNQQTGPILETRGQALEALSRIKQLQALDPYPPQLGLLAKVAETLPKDGSYLKEWEFQNGKLKVQIASPDKLASSDYIKQFQSFGVFNNVLATSGNTPTNLTLSMEVLPHSEIKFATEDNEATIKDAGKEPVLVPPPLKSH